MHIQKELEKKVSRLLDKYPQNMSHALGIEFQSFKKNKIEATMPVDKRTIQPFGILHGGASVALAETLASIGAWLNVDEGKAAVGVEINANHLRSVPAEHVVSATAVPIHIGRQTQVWETKIINENNKLVCISRCTLAVINQQK